MRKSASAQVDGFCARLNAGLASMTWEERDALFVRVGRLELRMRADGQERPTWKGPTDEDRLLGANVIVPTDDGEQTGRVVCFGLLNMGAEYERSVIVRIPATGMQLEVPGSAARLADPLETRQAVADIQLSCPVAAADVPEQTAPRQAKKRGARDLRILDRMLSAAFDHPNVRVVEEAGANHKVVGVDDSRRLYVFKRQLRVDVSGFSPDHPGIRKISDVEATALHLGRVRGQVIFGDDTQAMAAFEAALKGLR